MRESSGEMTMTEEGVVFSKDPEITGDVVYRFNFNIKRSPEEFEVEVTDVDVEEVKNLVYDEDGSPVMLNEASRQKFNQVAYNYFWKNSIHRAEEKATDKVRWGPW